jgi:23S rRNA (uracil1939-C5)-methyltransferase
MVNRAHNVAKIDNIENTMSKRSRKSLPKTPILATIESLSHDGMGIARVDGKTTFIQGALPGEDVFFKLTERKKTFEKGVCVEVIKPSPKRVTPGCHFYEICGGCSYQHLDSNDQISKKEQVLIELLDHNTPASGYQVMPPIKNKVWAYRHKARLSVRYVEKKERVLVGFRERLHGRFIADINECKVLAKPIGDLIQPLKDLIASLSNYTDIAQIEVAIAENQSALILRHLSPLTQDDLDKLGQFGKAYQLSWYLQSGGLDTVKPLDESTPLLDYMLKEFNLSYQYKPTDFTQVNPAINEAMVTQAIEWLEVNEDDIVLDLFCGLGNFSLALATKAKRVVGVEGSLEMRQRASDNALLNTVNNCKFYAANLFDSAEFNSDWANPSYNKVLLDPPRAGAEVLCENMDKFKPTKILYVSCAPQTLARDAKILIDKQGYKLSKVGVMDMFPHTSHIESMALFIR